MLIVQLICFKLSRCMFLGSPVSLSLNRHCNFKRQKMVISIKTMKESVDVQVLMSGAERNSWTPMWD